MGMISTSCEAVLQEILSTRADMVTNSAMQTNFSDICFVNTNFKYENSDLNFEIELNSGLSANVWGKIGGLSAAYKIRIYNK